MLSIVMLLVANVWVLLKQSFMAHLTVFLDAELFELLSHTVDAQFAVIVTFISLFIAFMLILCLTHHLFALGFILFLDRLVNLHKSLLKVAAHEILVLI